MRFRSLLDAQKRNAFMAKIKKDASYPFRRPVVARPIFIFGRQRSGTSMLMYCFHLHPDTIVFDEHRDSPFFHQYQLRSLDLVSDYLQASPAPFVCIKPICDSHRVMEFIHRFPQGAHLWMYRHYKASARSSLVKFRNPTRAIRLVCEGKSGGGWFQDGISVTIEHVLRSIYSSRLSDLDLACLTWWARNQIFLEQQLSQQPSITLVRYESLAQQPEEELGWLFSRIGLRQRDQCARFIKPTTAHSAAEDKVDAHVEELCEQALNALERAYESRRRPTGSTTP